MYFSRPLLHSKLQKPGQDSSCIVRMRLLDRLNEEARASFVMIHAPAGYGKTTLLSQWVEQTSGPVGWVSLDEEDNEPGVFMAYLVAAFQHNFPNVCQEVSSLLNTTPLPPTIVLWDTLIYEISLMGKMALVLDDVHHIHNHEIKEGLTRLIQHKPVNLRLFFATRTALNWLSIYRLRRDFLAFGIQDLGFQPEEAQTFLSRSLGELNAGDVETVVSQTEGWALGLRLLARAVMHGEDFSRWADVFRAGSPGVLREYLREEVLRPLSPLLQRFLLKTSLLERFSVSLCQALDDDWEARALLAQVREQGLFLYALGVEEEWFRYHPLFRAFLKQEAQNVLQADLREVYLRAGRWWNAHGFILEACEYALAAGAVAEAVRFVMENLHKVLDRQEYPALEQWLNCFPKEIIQQYPALLVGQAYLLYQKNYLEAIPQLLNRASFLLDEPPVSLTGEEMEALKADVEVLFAQVYYWHLDLGRARTAGERALKHLPFTHLYARGAVMAIIFASYAVQGDPQQALKLAKAELARTDPQDMALMTQLIYTQGIIEMLVGNYQAMIEGRDQFLQMVAKGPGALFLGRGFYALGMAYYERNELEEALVYWGKLLPLRYRTSHYVYFQGVMGLALANAALGLSQDAEYFARLGEEFAHEMQQEEMRLDAGALWVRLALWQGKNLDEGAAAHALEDVVPTPYDFFKISVQTAVLTHIWFLICQNTSHSLKKAEKLVQTSFEMTGSFHNVPLQIKLFALQALVCAAKNNQEAAERALLQAINLAKPRGFVRAFVDLGANMHALIAALIKNRVSHPYLLTLFHAFPEDAKSSLQMHMMTKKTARLFKLTKREQEVLNFLSKRYSNKEIASHLSISSETVRRHTANIYAKFGVKNRREAVLFASKQGLLRG